MSKGWLIAEYTGSPYKDYKVTFGTIACAGSVATVSVDGAISAAIGIGSAAAADVRCTSSAAQLAGGTAIFTSDNATEKVHYFIIHKGLK